jgi:hypothetical protein
MTLRRMENRFALADEGISSPNSNKVSIVVAQSCDAMLLRAGHCCQPASRAILLSKTSLMHRQMHDGEERQRC